MPLDLVIMNESNELTFYTSLHLLTYVSLSLLGPISLSFFPICGSVYPQWSVGEGTLNHKWLAGNYSSTPDIYSNIHLATSSGDCR